jgi:hypothetical protein
VNCPEWDGTAIRGPDGFLRDIHPKAAYAPWRRTCGPALTPRTPRQAPGPRADYGLIRNAVEEIWRVLHQYYAMYKSQSWATSASLDILLGVIARVVAGVANIRRLARLQGRDEIRDPRVIMLERRKVCGLTVERARRRSSRRPKGIDPPWSIIHLVAY